MNLLRSVSILALASAALSAHAVVYAFGTFDYGAFLVEVPTTITKYTEFNLFFNTNPYPGFNPVRYATGSNQLGPIGSITFMPNYQGADTIYVSYYWTGSFAEFSYAPGTFSNFGTFYSGYRFGATGARLKIVDTPSPAAALPFALMALKRRKRHAA